VKCKVLVLAALLAGACSVDRGLPTAVLDAPGCVAAGTEVMLSALDSSDSGGEIIRYTFAIGSEIAPASTREPVYSHKFVDAEVQPADGPAYTNVKLTVLDNEGNTAQATAKVYVVDDLDECPEGVTVREPSEPEPEVVSDVGAEEVVSDLLADSGPAGDVVACPEGPGDCPDASGEYKLRLYCGGQEIADIGKDPEDPEDEGKTSLFFFQCNCGLNDNWGILDSGAIDQAGNMTLAASADFSDMGQCSGLYAPDDPLFDLPCDNDCYVVLKKL